MPIQIPTADVLVNGGTPDPLTFRQARPVCADALVFTDTTTFVLPIAGALAVRLRGKFTAAGTLSFHYRRPPPHSGTAYDNSLSSPHADVVVVANTEFQVDPINPVGECYLAVTWTPTDPGTPGAVTFFDQSQQ